MLFDTSTRGSNVLRRTQRQMTSRRAEPSRVLVEALMREAGEAENALAVQFAYLLIKSFVSYQDSGIKLPET